MAILHALLPVYGNSGVMAAMTLWKLSCMESSDVIHGDLVFACGTPIAASAALPLAAELEK